MIAEWKAAVADGSTTLGFDAWLPHSRQLRKLRECKPALVEVAATLRVEVRGANSDAQALEMLRHAWGSGSKPLNLIDSYGNYLIGVRLAQ